MSENEMRVSFEGVDTATAGVYAQELRKYILDQAPRGVQVTVKRDDPTAMNSGNLLDILIPIGAHVAVLAVCEGIKLWQDMKKVPVRIEARGKVVCTDHVTPELAEEIKQKYMEQPAKQG
jgi:hypothetical protein